MGEMEQKRLDYNLNEDSLVFDVGGYLGEWSQKIVNKFNCKVYIFEPIKSYFDSILSKFKDNGKVKMFNIALGGESDECTIHKMNDRSSIYIGGGQEEKIIKKSFTDFIKEHPFEKIDLMKINIEGEEYNLLNNIIDNNLHTKINNIQIQFHKTYPNYDVIRNEIIDKLKITHNRTFNYEMVWENWELKT